MFGKKEKAKAAWVQTALERYERPLIQYAMSIVQSLDRARDVVQETFMRLHKQEQAKIEGHLSQWLFTVCRNCALKSLKKEERYIYVEAQEFEQKRCEKLTPSMEMERKERTERVMELVRRLPKNQHEPDGSAVVVEVRASALFESLGGGVEEAQVCEVVVCLAVGQYV